MILIDAIWQPREKYCSLYFSIDHSLYCSGLFDTYVGNIYTSVLYYAITKLPLASSAETDYIYRVTDL